MKLKLDSWCRKLVWYEEGRNIMFEDTLHQNTHSMSKALAWELYLKGSLKDYVLNSLKYAPISPELEQTGNFFMKRFTMRT
jgi:hypothetical protein